MSDPQDFFERHHAAYRVSRAHARGADLDTLASAMAPLTGTRVLDVATGTGHTALRLAAQGAAVTGLDPSPAMLREAEALARQGTVAVTWMIGTAEHLPFAAAAFERVTCRRAAHHFTDIAQFLQEARRVLVPGGWIGISDMTAPADAIGHLNTLERLRDPSHRQALTREQWQTSLHSAGFCEISAEPSTEPMSWQQWLSPVSPQEAAGQQALAYLRQIARPGALAELPDRFIKHRLVIWAQKPQAPLP
ncbi:MAG: class I SAM-dependent methyltransferase [Thermaerobacter sp.]|nr:class I SAM-dependent methyltransferase [Thermaerobacter sp.]